MKYEVTFLGEHSFGEVWCDMNQLIIYLLKAFIPPSSRYSIHPFLQIIRMVHHSWCDKELDQFRPPSSGGGLCLLFCTYPYSMRRIEPDFFAEQSAMTTV